MEMQNSFQTNYEMLIYRSAEDEAFLAEMPELPGCMADGLTRAEALQQAEIVIEQWIETARIGQANPGAEREIIVRVRHTSREPLGY